MMPMTGDGVVVRRGTTTGGRNWEEPQGFDGLGRFFGGVRKRPERARRDLRRVVKAQVAIEKVDHGPGTLTGDRTGAKNAAPATEVGLMISSPRGGSPDRLGHPRERGIAGRGLLPNGLGRNPEKTISGSAESRLHWSFQTAYTAQYTDPIPHLVRSYSEWAPETESGSPRDHSPMG